MQDENTIKSHLSTLQCHFSDQLASWKYFCHLSYLILRVIDEIDLNSSEKSQLLSVNQLNAIVHAIQECTTSGLDVCVKKQQNRFTYNTTNQSDEEYQRLTGCLRMFRRFFGIKLIASNHLFDDAKLDYMIGILSVISLKKNQDDVIEFLNVFASITSTFPMDLVFKFLMMMRGFSGFSKDLQLLVHREMMRKIRSPNGFLVLCKNLLVMPHDSKVPAWQKCGMISKIIEGIVSSKAHQQFMVDEIFRTLDLTLKNDDRDIVGACAFVLKNLETKDDADLKKIIYLKVLGPLEELATPEDVLFGSIVLERQQMLDMINRLHVLFSSSTIASLPSSILRKHIAVLFNLYTLLPDSPESTKLASVVVFFLSNRDRKELQKAIQVFRLKDDDAQLKIHPRICFKNEALQIGDEQGDDTEAFLNLLRNSNNNFLIFDVFICLINTLGVVQSSGDNFLSEYDVDEEDLPNVLHKKFFKKLAILEPLQEMIQWKSLHTQLNEKPKEVLDVIKEVLLKIVEKADAMDEQLMVIFFSLFKELIHKLKDDNQRKLMRKEVLRIKDKCKNAELREQIQAIFNEQEVIPNVDPSQMAFDDAMNLLRSDEIYCKVYGSDTLIKLLKKRDKQTVANRHTVLAVALQNMRETESYAYLNIIRLLVALSYVMDTEVVDALIADFKNQELEIDERLKIGEVIVKVTEDLGQFAVKFKQPLIDCFLKGSRDSNNEFRTSSLANLGSICKTLSYQMHNFFHEMFQQLEIIIKSDEYLPSKRAAALVLSQVLSGIPSLMDFQEYLSPIYRLLKDILENETDQETRLHAGVGLDHLNAKTKDFLNPDLEMAKEIKIRLDENPHKISDIKYK